MAAGNDKSEGLWLSELKAERMRAGLTQVELVKESGVSRGTLVRLETGRRPAQSRTARKLAEALGVSIRRLAGEEESIVPAADEGLTEPGAPQPHGTEEDDYLHVYVSGRTEEEVIEEARRWYRHMTRPARAQASSEDHLEPENPEPEVLRWTDEGGG